MTVVKSDNTFSPQEKIHNSFLCRWFISILISNRFCLIPLAVKCMSSSSLNLKSSQGNEGDNTSFIIVWENNKSHFGYWNTPWSIWVYFILCFENCWQYIQRNRYQQYKVKAMIPPQSPTSLQLLHWIRKSQISRAKTNCLKNNVLLTFSLATWNSLQMPLIWNPNSRIERRQILKSRLRFVSVILSYSSIRASRTLRSLRDAKETYQC